MSASTDQIAMLNEPANQPGNSAHRSGEVDALRCFAMLGVILMHAHLLPMGWIGVWLFYVVSGYVVTLSIVTRPAEAPGTALTGFFRRRIARIVPVYFLYIVVGLVVCALLDTLQRPISIASLFLFFNNIAMIGGVGELRGWPTGHLWTLSTEMQFYLLYGLALCLLPRRTTIALLIGLLALCPVARLLSGIGLTQHSWSALDAAYAIYAGPGLHFDIFAMGCLLAFLQCDGRLQTMARPLLLFGLAALALYMTAYGAVNIMVRHQHGLGSARNIISGILIGQHREVFLYSAIGLAMSGLVAAAAVRDSWLQPLLGVKAFQWVGAISYGGYLFHGLGLRGATLLLGHHAGPRASVQGLTLHGLSFLICCLITITLAWASDRWFERPLRRLLSGGYKPVIPTLPPLQAASS